MKILIAEDHNLIRAALRNLLSSQFDSVEIEEATNGLEAVEKAKTFDPDLVILDYEMPQYNGIYAARTISKDLPEMPILILTMHSGRSEILASLQAGAKGFLPKEVETEELTDAINALLAGCQWFKGKVGEVVSEYEVAEKSVRIKQNVGGLSGRQIEVIALIVRGLTNEEISDKLHISIRTVELHKWRIYQKLRLKKVSDLILYVIKNNILDSELGDDIDPNTLN